MQGLLFPKAEVDFRLLFLQLKAKWVQVLLFSCLGTILIWGGYCLRYVILVPPPLYEMTSIYEVSLFQEFVSNIDQAE
ncbi:MAG: hypothetical protein LBM69_01690, partial [Lachnospiraceae bacterium]|nr:hypothetical protein [Lachnospiraceae bacterium]